MIQTMRNKRKLESEWLVNLLESKFFGSCNDHQNLRKNEKNVFCIDCSLCFCKHCITSKTHCLHRHLQICRYVYHDVVRLQDIQKHLDCSKIQTYKINGEKAVHLNPRSQQQKDSKPSKPKIGGTYCEACGRHIQDLPNRFCSIACKVSIMAATSEDESQKMVSYFSWKGSEVPERNVNENESSLSWSTESMEENNQSCSWLTSNLKRKKIMLHKRKGVPCRAPFN